MHLYVFFIITIAVSIALNVSADSTRDTEFILPGTLRGRSFDNNGKEERAGGGGVSIPTSEKIATLFKSSKVTDEQLQKWLDQRSPAEIVFYRMKLTKTHKWIFDNPQFSKWVQYADDLSATGTGKGTSAISILIAQYGDDKLYKILKTAKRDSHSEELASRLQMDQLKYWVAIGKDPDEVYKLYGLQYAFDVLFRDPQFSAWTKYVDNLNARHEGAISIIPTLRKYYSDGDLFSMVEAAKATKETESMSLKLEDAFVQFWINDKKTPVDILAELRLKVSPKMLESSQFDLLVKFMDAYTLKFPQTKTTMIETFTNSLGDETVAKILAAVKTNDWKVKKLAAELESAQLKMWLSSGKFIDDVYDLLKLPSRNAVNDFGAIPLFSTWVAYMNTFSIENPDKVSKCLSRMVTQFDDRPMMQIFNAVEKFPSMEKVAVALQLQKAENVFAAGASPHKAFTTVALDEVGYSVLSSPVFTKWMTYVEDFNKKHPGKHESWFSTLYHFHPGNRLDNLMEAARENPTTVKIVDMVEKARMEEWLTRKNPPKYVLEYFRLFNLDKAGENLLSSPNFQLWVKYLDDFNKKYPGEKTTMIENIRANYDDSSLVRILDAAEKAPSTEELAKNLQNALIYKWIDEKVPVAQLKQRIVTDGQLQKWLKKGQSTKAVFYRMKLGKARTWIFDHPQFSKWVQYADDLSVIVSGKRTSAISTLTAQYGDDQLSKELASRLQGDQFKRWIAIGKDLVNLNSEEEEEISMEIFATIERVVALKKKAPPCSKQDLETKVRIWYTSESAGSAYLDTSLIVMMCGNYFHWEYDMRMTLARKGLLAHVQEVKAESEITEAWLVNDAKALGIIAQGAWGTLREFYNETTLHNRVTMTRRLHDFKMDDGTSMAKHLDDFD
ncbi:hypothetical protein P3T76_010352 [Phytophthora citrophthora]|uniref:RxLR effector PexRD54 WY domain-containing protein n=1 Tax=Phytophthora citrophthora TaxID=4793 RepID=A0AAD9GC83_9STRA|nr:hypothetical protein P3T76_010352 [Phytophthora citrophthora]